MSDGSCLRYVTSQPVEDRLRKDRSRLTCALDENSDLVPNVYEGKIISKKEKKKKRKKEIKNNTSTISHGNI